MKLTNAFILVFILLIAVLLRFWDIFSIPLTYDEFSALFRTQFATFNELIEKGVKVDGHPAAIQVFLYYWVKIAGFNNWFIKLPFILMGLGSLYFIYRIAKDWYNETAALLVLAMVSTIQFHVMYSQIARPYISGLFFTSAMVFYWSQMIKEPEKKQLLNTILYLISATLCAYNHHFSLLFVALVWISGLFILNRNFFIKYLVLGIMIFVLYIPHLPIFFYQLSLGGVEGWLGKPEPDFLLVFVYYLFNYSLVSISVVALVLVWGIYRSKPISFNPRFFWLSLGWFMIPFLMGYYYSVFVNSVMQFSVLLFSFPFLFFILFGFIKPQTVKVNLVLVLLILSANAFSLIIQRQHYSIFYNSPHDQIVVDYQNNKKVNPNTLSVLDLDMDITRFYLKEMKVDSNFLWFNSFQKESEFIDYLSQQSPQTDYFFLGCLSGNNPLTVPMIQDFYPTLVWQKNYAGGTSYLFSKEGASNQTLITKATFDTKEITNFSGIIEANRIDSIGFSDTHCYAMNANTEWSPVFSKPLNEIISHENNFIDIAVKVKMDSSFTDAILAASLDSNGKSVYWGGTGFKQLIPENYKHNDWQTIHHSIKLSDADLKHNHLQLKVYIWNNQKQSFLLDDLTVHLREGNPVIYGWLERF